jgi:prostatic aicd phosphatase
MQGLFPPTQSANLQTLANGTSESDPLNGYQYVLVNGLTATAPDIIWIAGDQSCPAMTKASKAYYNSTKFLTIQNQTQSFYNKFRPLLSDIFEDSDVGFQSAYNIFDYFNVGYNHNKTIYSNVSTDDLFQLRTLADSQSFDLNYNASSPNASIGGKTLAGNILSHLNQTASQSNPNVKVTYFVGAYSPMMAFWGISGIANTSSNFMGLPDYASTMAFELRRPANTSGFNDLSVRFGFRNGSLPSAELNYFPMFGRGQNETDMTWSDFAQAMSRISISSDAAWCSACNSNMTFCIGSSSSSASASGVNSTGSQGTAQSSQSSGGLSNAAAGGIGAGVTIGVIALIEGAVALWYLSHRKRPLSPVSSEVGSK